MEACKLIVPNGGKFQSTSGSILKATTMNRSGFKSFTFCKNNSFLRLVGWRTGIFKVKAASLTAEINHSFFPLPPSLSGAVITAGMVKPES